ncbi:hypothetical protein MKX08_005331 [Trichoderma sp. CBMAI-0020]|nr:hypothetical protein MKX08_005331 [Trichoderma sp. CBMAI-0020]
MRLLLTATNGEASIERGYVLKSTDGRYRVTPLSTVGELQFQLLSTPRTIVLPGPLDEATIQVLTSYGVPHQFLKAHLEGTEYSWRGGRPHDATSTQVQPDSALEDEPREKLPRAGPNISIKDYVNQLVYERWATYIAELSIERISSDLIWYAMECVEQNLDTARYIAREGDTLYLADEHAWEDLLRRLDRRMRYSKA